MLSPKQVAFLDRYVGRVPDSSRTTDDGDSETDLQSALDPLTPRIRDVLAAFPSMKKEIAGLVTAVKGGDAEALAQLRKLCDDALSKIAGAGQGTASVSVARLGKARLEWDGLRIDALKSVDTLKSNIRTAYGPQSDVAKEVDAALSRLDGAIGQLNEELSSELDKLLNLSDAAKRSAKAEDVARLAGRFLDLTTSDPILSAIDGTVFMPGVSVVKPLRGKLNDILSAIGQVRAEATG